MNAITTNGLQHTKSEEFLVKHVSYKQPTNYLLTPSTSNSAQDEFE